MAANDESKIENFMECDYMKYDFTEDWNVENCEKLEEHQKKLEEYKDMGIWKKYFTYKMVLTPTYYAPKDNYYPDAHTFWEKVRKKYSYNEDSKTPFLILDPDTHSKLLQELYGELWKKDLLKKDPLKWCKDDDNNIHGDTMNTIQTTLSWYVRLCYDSDERYYGALSKNGFKNNPGSISQTLQIFCENEGFLKVENNNLDVESLEEFIEYNHTLGNFIPVPFKTKGGSFNAPRSATTNDFWDLTLYRIYCWYKMNDEDENCNCEQKNDIKNDEVENCDCKKNKDLCALLGKNCQNVKLCIKWLKTFRSWNKFVEKNFLDMYVVNLGEKEFGIPKPLWCNGENYDFEKLKHTEDEKLWDESHKDINKLWEKRLKDNKCEDIPACVQYFANAKMCIEKRTGLMIDWLKKKTEAT